MWGWTGLYIGDHKYRWDHPSSVAVAYNRRWNQWTSLRGWSYDGEIMILSQQFPRLKATSSCGVQLSPGQSQGSAYWSTMVQSMAAGTYTSCDRYDVCILEQSLNSLLDPVLSLFPIFGWNPRRYADLAMYLWIEQTQRSRMVRSLSVGPLLASALAWLGAVEAVLVPGCQTIAPREKNLTSVRTARNYFRRRQVCLR